MLKHFHTKHLYLKYSKKIKNFLLSPKSREFLIFLFFLLMACCFWLLQTLDNEYETELSIPLRIKDVPEEVVITTEPISDIKVKVKDRGTVLFNYLLKRQFSPINIDFAEEVVKDNHVKIRTSDLERKIINQLNVSTRLLSTYPDTIEYYYSSGRSKLVPAKFGGEVSPARQYYISDILLSPDSVTVYAPSSILDTLTIAYTHHVEINNVSDTLSRVIELAAIKGVKFVPNKVKCTFLTDIYTEKTIEVPIIGANFPPDKVLRTFPSKVQVTFKIGMGDFKYITPEDFLIIVPYDEIVNSDAPKCKVSLQRYPTNVSQIRIIPDQVDFLIEQISPIKK